LIDNPDHPIKKLSFKKVKLGEDGLHRIIEAANMNHHITSLNLGIVSDRGLASLAKCLIHNETLEKLKFAESEDEPWKEATKQLFVDRLSNNKHLVKIKFESAKESDNSAFKKQIQFKVKKIKKPHKKLDDQEERTTSCTHDHLFNSLLQMIENRDDHEKMPVRKFFNNTFGTLINDALFALKKKQRKSNNNGIMTMQG